MPSAQAADRTVSELIPVGQTVGVKLFSDGVLVVGFSDGESPAKDCGLKEGDVITAIGGQSLDTIEEFRQLLAENGEDAAALTVKRGSRTIELSAEPEKDEDGEYRLGAWVRDSMAGIGTMTFYDPQSGTFGALGHGVTDVDTGQLLPLDHGSIMDASVKAVKKGERASPGELKGDFDLTRDSGTLYALRSKITVDKLHNLSSALSHKSNHINIGFYIACNHTHKRTFADAASGKNTHSLALSYGKHAVDSFNAEFKRFSDRRSFKRIRTHSVLSLIHI